MEQLLSKRTINELNKDLKICYKIGIKPQYIIRHNSEISSYYWVEWYEGDNIYTSLFGDYLSHSKKFAKLKPEKKYTLKELGLFEGEEV